MPAHGIVAGSQARSQRDPLMMRSLFVSTIVYFAAAFFIKRRLQAMDLPRGMTRGLLTFCLALMAAYAAAAALDWLLPPT